MIVLLTGATGFIGSHLLQALARRGHEVICVSRRAVAASAGDACHRRLHMDWAAATRPEDWTPHLQGVDVAVNAAGILRETGGDSFDSAHVDTPKALFSACAALGIRVVQVSALGAADGSRLRYFTSKDEADSFLLTVSDKSVVVQPSLVFGATGGSARLFLALASLPLVPLPGDGRQTIQPIYIDDLTAAIVALVGNERHAGRRVPLVGPEPVVLREYLNALRLGMRMRPARFLPVAAPLMRAMAAVASRFPRSLLTRDSFSMLARGNSASPAATEDLLGRPPRAVSAFICPSHAPLLRRSALLAWQLPLLRFAVAVVWIVSGVVSLGLYPLHDSLALLARAGITGQAAPLALGAAALLDIALGIATLTLRRRRWLWDIQAAVILGYMGIVTLALPEFWLHPFGPIVKNLPLLVGIWMLRELER